MFVVMAVVMTRISVSAYNPDFSETKLKFTVINRDGVGPLTDGLIEFLGSRGEHTILEDRKDALQDATFFHATDFIFIVPQGFRDGFFSGAPIKAEHVLTTDSALGYYAESLADQYLNLSRLYLAANPGMDEKNLASAVLGDLSIRVGVEKKRFGESEPINENYHVFARMTPYMLMVLIILCVSCVMLAFRRPDLNMRNLCAPIKARSMWLQQILCYGLMSLSAWIVMNAAGFILYGSKLAGADGRIIIMVTLNTFVYTVVSTAIASLAGSFIRGPNSQNALANSLSLVLSFIGGVFVPLDLLGEGLLTISRFTPTYWYVTALDRACALTSFGADTVSPVLQAMLIQLGFAAAIFCVSLAVNKRRNESEGSFSSVKTELAA
jgi:ABC-2 type transport system permease protein